METAPPPGPCLDLPWVDGHVAVRAVVLHMSCVELLQAMGTTRMGKIPGSRIKPSP
jgi:hypothetical protein